MSCCLEWLKVVHHSGLKVWRCLEVDRPSGTWSRPAHLVLDGHRVDRIWTVIASLEVVACVIVGLDWATGYTHRQEEVGPPVEAVCSLWMNQPGAVATSWPCAHRAAASRSCTHWARAHRVSIVSSLDRAQVSALPHHAAPSLSLLDPKKVGASER
jgi:hypothetical protein